MGGGLDREVQLLEPTVAADVTQVQHLDALLDDEADDVGACELLGLLTQSLHQRVRVECDSVSG